MSDFIKQQSITSGLPLIALEEPKNLGIPPGSIVFASYFVTTDVKGILGTMRGVMARRGKSGSPRADQCAFRVPIYTGKYVPFDDEELLKYLKVKVDICGDFDCNLINYHPSMFIPWAVSKIVFIYHLHASYRFSKSTESIRLWNEGDELDCLYTLSRSGKIIESSIIDFYRKKETRVSLIEKIRKKESEFARLNFLYNTDLKSMEITSLRNMVYILVSENKTTKLEYSNDVRDKIDSLNNKINSEYSALREIRRLVMTGRLEVIN